MGKLILNQLINRDCKTSFAAFYRLGIAMLLFGLLPYQAFSQNGRAVTGTIQDERTPMPGVKITVKRTKVAVASNPDGKYRISVTNRDTLQFSYVGYYTKEIAVGTSQVINVTMESSSSNLNEVLVVGYGTVRKSDLTGSVSQVNLNDLTKAPVSSFAEALAGRVAGVQVSSNDGQPGGGMNIVIRGANSLTQSNAPLYVIDGFPIEDPEAAAINPEDIESMNILKDASATAIYGSRAANGVIVIETKRGKLGKPTIDLKSSYGFQQEKQQMDMMSPYEFIKYYLEIFPDLTRDTYLTEGRSLEDYRNEAGINWQDKILRSSFTQINSLAVRGGSEQTRYAISGSNYEQKGVVINSDYKRYQAGMSVDQGIGKKIKVGLNANFGRISTNGETFSAVDSRTIDSYMFYSMWGYRPISSPGVDLLDEDFDPFNPDDIHNMINPVVQRENDYTHKTSNSLRANSYLTYAIVKGLNLRVTGSVDSYESEVDKFNNSRTPLGRQSAFNVRGINGSIDNYGRYVWSNENTLTYDKLFDKNNKLTLLGGFSMQGIQTKISSFATQNIPNEVLRMDGLDEGIPYTSKSSRSESTLASFFGRVNYNYKSKYLITANFRGDGSSKFAPGKRWGYFPSGALAWNMTGEQFLKKLEWLSNSKLRVSYGITGNNRVSDFPYLSNLSFPTGSSYSFNNGTPVLGAIPSNLANTDLKWESTSQLNIGYDFGLFDNRIELTADFYRKVTDDLLLNADLPYSTGYVSAFNNIGKISNTGLELSLHTINLRSTRLKWETNFNISFNKNKILSLSRGQESMFTIVPLTQFNLPLYIAQIGQPAGMFYGYIFDGVYQLSDFENPAPGKYVLKNNLPTNGNTRTVIQPGDIRYKDLNGDGIVNATDQAVIGRGQAVHTGGFNNNFSYDGFDLGIFLQWSYGNEIYNANRLFLEGNASTAQFKNQFASYKERWTPDNPSNTLFRAGGQGPIQHSSRVIEDGSYLRLKTLSVGYTLPVRYVKKMALTQLRINMAAQNLITWTNYSGMDPEVSVRNSVLTPGFDFSAYPQSRTITFGINATF